MHAHVHTYTRRQCDHESRDWRDMTTNQGILAATRCWQSRNGFSPEAFRRKAALQMP